MCVGFVKDNPIYPNLPVHSSRDAAVHVHIKVMAEANKYGIGLSL